MQQEEERKSELDTKRRSELKQKQQKRSKNKEIKEVKTYILQPIIHSLELKSSQIKLSDSRIPSKLQSTNDQGADAKLQTSEKSDSKLQEPEPSQIK